MENRISHINSEYIELNKLLKFEALVDSGGQAKQVISSGAVTVNGEVVTQIRKKIRQGDVVVVGDFHLRITSD